MATAEVSQPAVRSEAARGAWRHRVANTPVNIFLVIVGLLWLIPAAGLFVTSLLPPEISNAEGWWNVFSKPSDLTLDNYRQMFDNDQITHALLVTAQVTIGATVLPVLIAALAGYALAWIDFPGADLIFVAIVGLMVVPIQMALIPMFTLYNKANLYDTVLGLILFHTAFALPLGIFLLRNFFIGIPKDLMEAARIDGASEIRIFLRLILPLGLPAIASLAIFQFLWTWNDLLVALTFGRETQPITVAIFTQLRQFGSNIELIAPAAFVSLALPLAVFFAFQRYFVQGLLAGSVK
jgi:alpha-glucoside transport system permease protein